MRQRSRLRPLVYGSIVGVIALGLGFGYAAAPGPGPISSQLAVGVSARSTVVPAVTAELRTATSDHASSNPRTQPADGAPKATSGTDAAQAASRAAWSRKVWAVGGQRQIDQCRGLVQVRFTSNRSVIAEHNTCGGAWILKVKRGQIIKLSGKVSGTFRATTFKAVPRGATAAVLNGMSRQGLVLQTCYFNSNLMRLVGLERV